MRLGCGLSWVSTETREESDARPARAGRREAADRGRAPRAEPSGEQLPPCAAVQGRGEPSCSGVRWRPSVTLPNTALDAGCLIIRGDQEEERSV